jgi:hypothetical protein
MNNRQEISVYKFARLIVKDLGGEITHVSTSGSCYLRFMEIQIRISNHWLREYNEFGETIRRSWQYEIVQRYFSTYDNSDEIREILIDEGISIPCPNSKIYKNE